MSTEMKTLRPRACCADADVDSAIKAMVPEGRTPADTAKALGTLLQEVVDPILDWRPDALEAALRGFGETSGWTANELFMAVRVATTGRSASPPLFETLAVLGKETCRRRLRRAALTLKGPKL